MEGVGGATQVFVVYQYLSVSVMRFFCVFFAKISDGLLGAVSLESQAVAPQISEYQLEERIQPGWD